jgi:pimeloyl-ACP methyl ester carboxylesterase
MENKIGAVNAKTKFVETGGRKIAYRSIGSGPPIILINRFRGNLDTWDPAFLDALASTFNVITVDCSGIGLSTGVCTTDVFEMAQDVKEIAEALGLTKTIVAGWSLGGMVAQAVMTQYPELVSHAIIIGAGPPGRNNSTTEKLFWQRALKPATNLDDGTVLLFEPQSESSKNAAKLSFGRIARRTEDLDNPVSKQCYSNQQKAVDEFREDKNDTLAKLESSKIPILIIMGDHDIAFSVEEWFALVGKLPSTQLIVMPQAGHGPQHQYPDLTAKYIASFIENSK